MLMKWKHHGSLLKQEQCSITGISGGFFSINPMDTVLLYHIPGNHRLCAGGKQRRVLEVSFD